MSYDSTTVYAKYLKTKCMEDCTSGCNDCNDDCSEDCSCCPPGLVAVTDENGKAAGCLTPADAAQYNTDKPCAPGFVKLTVVATSKFLGCVSESEFAALYAAVNP